MTSHSIRSFNECQADERKELGRGPCSVKALLRQPYIWVPTLIVAETLINILWAIHDHTTPSWDQSHYLNVALDLEQALLHHGPVGFVHALYTTDPGRAPFFEIVLMIFYMIFGAGTRAGRLLEVSLWPLMLYSVAAITGKYTQSIAAKIIAVLIVGSIPELVYLSHTVLQDFMLGTIATIAMLALLRTEFLTEIWASVTLGLVIAVGTLTKVSFLTTISVPIVCALCLILMKPTLVMRTNSARRIRSNRIRALMGGSIVSLIGIGVPLIWYIPNLAATRAYLAVTFAQQPGTVSHPLAFHNLASFAMSVLNNAYSWPFLFLGIYAILLMQWRGSSSKFNSRKLAMLLILGSWAIVPLIVVAVNDNPDPRYAVASYPAIAIVSAIALARIRWPSLRWLGEAVGSAYALAIIAGYSISGFSSAAQRLVISFPTPGGQAYILPGGYGGAPTPQNFGLAVFHSLDKLASKVPPINGVVPVALLELNGDVNGNNMPYFNQLAGDNLSFDTLVPFPVTSSRGLAQVLNGFDFVLHRELAPASQSALYGRVAQLNAGAAAYSLKPSSLAGFQLVFRIHGGADVGQSPWLDLYERRGLGRSG